MNIEYDITVQDDLDAEQTLREFRLSLSLIKWAYRGIVAFLYIVSLGLILEATINFADAVSIYILLLGISNLILCIIAPYVVNPESIQSQWYRKTTEKMWDKYYLQQNIRSITITEKEFVFATQDFEQAWKWQAIKCFYEGTNGFMLSFFAGQNVFISKRGLKTQSQLDEFKSLIQQYSNLANNDD